MEEVLKFVCGGWTGYQEILGDLERMGLEDCVNMWRDLEEAVDSKEVPCVVQNREHKFNRQLLKNVHA